MNILKNKLTEEATEAMKRRDSNRLSVIRYTLGVIQTAEKKSKTQTELTDAEITNIISNLAKQTKDNISLYTEAGETDKVAEAEAELAILNEYLPAQLTEAEVRELVADAVASAGGNPNLGTIMKIVVPLTKNKADGKLVKDIVMEALNS